MNNTNAECVKIARANRYDVTFDNKSYSALGAAANDIIRNIYDTYKDQEMASFNDFLYYLKDKHKIKHSNPAVLASKVKPEDNCRYNDAVRMFDQDVRISAGWDGTENGNFKKLKELAESIDGFPKISVTAR